MGNQCGIKWCCSDLGSGNGEGKRGLPVGDSPEWHCHKRRVRFQGPDTGDAVPGLDPVAGWCWICRDQSHPGEMSCDVTSLFDQARGSYSAAFCFLQWPSKAGWAKQSMKTTLFPSIWYTASIHRGSSQWLLTLIRLGPACTEKDGLQASFL